MKMTDDPPKYLTMDTHCWRCDHHWVDHFEKGCLHVINKGEMVRFGDRPKLCACKESTNKHYNNYK